MSALNVTQKHLARPGPARRALKHPRALSRIWKQGEWMRGRGGRRMMGLGRTGEEEKKIRMMADGRACMTKH